jgi:Uncharacterized alpha/beta hydrolase domain (DUF2235)/KAP family P-loop domain
MGRQIIFCADGIWDGSSNRTNVYKLFSAVATSSDQVRLYDDGIGPNGLSIEKLTGDAVGEQLFAKVREGYTRIARAYQEGDQLFLFGFSRGAYTARSVAGMIAICGLPADYFDESKVSNAFQAYRDKAARPKLLSEMSKQPLFHPKVSMLGVWDTVGSLGIPAHLSGDAAFNFGFLDTSLHPSIMSAYQALAIDERRGQYVPTLWSSTMPGQIVEQVWFSGTHLDVGGGGADETAEFMLSDIPLAWMMAEASARGIQFDPKVFARYVPPGTNVALGQIHETWSVLDGVPRLRSIPSGAVISNSVGARCRYDPTYRPDNLSLINGEPAPSYLVSPVVNEDLGYEGGSEASAAATPAPAQEAKRVEVVDAAAVGYRSTYAAFEGDLVGFDQRSFKDDLKDSLGADVYAGYLAQLISAKSTPLPLSIGLFGDWGAGKSFFMRLLHQKIDKLADQEDEVFCRKVSQIHFNAWHYLDTNLWANLVSEIFEQLFAYLAQKPGTKERVAELKKKLADESALAAEAKKELVVATNARGEAEKEWLQAAQKRKQEEASFATYIDDLAHVALSEDTRNALKELSDGLNLTRLGESFSDLEASAMDARSLAGRLRILALSVLSPQGLYRRFSLLLVALLAPVAAAYLVPKLLRTQTSELAAIARGIAGTATLIGAISAWIAAQTKRGMTLIGKVEAAYALVKKAREESLKGEEGSGMQQALNKLIKEEADAGEKLKETQARVRAIEAELHDLTPGRRLLHFLEQRAGASDYRQYLGLVSLVRRDFEQLSNLLGERASDESDEPVLDRIVLYIDDLDRCKSDRVIAVLEAVHLLLAFPIFAVVVAVDPRWLRQSLMEHYPTLLSDGRKPESHILGEDAEWPASPQDYMEKIFQVPFQIQSIEKEGFEKLVLQLLQTDAADKAAAATDVASDTLREPAAAATAAADPGPAPISTEQKLQAGNPTPETGQLSDATAPPPDAAAPPSDAEAPAPVKAPEAIQAALERLRLEEWEREAINECYPLFRTPRAVKRLINTYCLIRVGVDATQWRQFLGSKAQPTAEYRTPLLMMAVAAAYPSLAVPWLQLVVKNEAWVAAVTESGIGGKHECTNNVQRQWDQLTAAMAQMNANVFAPFDTDLAVKWARKVRRYTF